MQPIAPAAPAATSHVKPTLIAAGGALLSALVAVVGLTKTGASGVEAATATGVGGAGFVSSLLGAIYSFVSVERLKLGHARARVQQLATGVVTELRAAEPVVQRVIHDATPAYAAAMAANAQVRADVPEVSKLEDRAKAFEERVLAAAEKTITAKLAEAGTNTAEVRSVLEAALAKLEPAAPVPAQGGVGGADLAVSASPTTTVGATIGDAPAPVAASVDNGAAQVPPVDPAAGQAS